MKRITAKQKAHHRRRSYLALQRRWGGKFPPRKDHNRPRIAKGKKHVLSAPTVFSLGTEGDRRKMLDFISRIDDLRDENARIAIDFKKTSTLHACGTLLFMSYLDGFLAADLGKLSCNYPDDEVVGQLLQHVGVLSKMGLSNRWEITSDVVKHWHYTHGACTDMSGLRTLMSDHEQSLSAEVRSQLFASLSEAITNVINHAYPESESHGNDKKWWMFSQRKDGKLFIAVCDHGIGIPGSLRAKPYLKDYLRRIFVTSRRRMDETLISDAVGSPRTVTQLPYRGKGLPEMLAFVKLLGDGSLSILSEHGAFSYKARLDHANSTTFRNAINGTLIFWEIPLEGSHGD